ncbi:MAG: hypothetical protein E7376_01735 [Clostridiales bacterium]|nr:hypothetical protein [Clostridiales bacterium]
MKTNKKSLLLLLFVAITVGLCGSFFITVNSNNVVKAETNVAKIYNGSSWTNYTTLESAISAASSGGTIVMLDDYEMQSYITINKNLTIVAQKDSKISAYDQRRGLFYVSSGKTLTLGSAASTYQNISLNNLYLDGDADESYSEEAMIYVAGTLNMYDGVCLQNNINYVSNGGGAIHGTETSIINIYGGKIINNKALKGGGIYSEGVIKIQNCEISNNVATDSDGGGLYTTSEVELINCTISNNVAVSSGGGAYFKYEAYVTNCTITNNNAGKFAGGIYAYSWLDIYGSTVSKNVAQSYGGGIFTLDQFYIDDCQVTNNEAEDGAGIWSEYGAVVTNSSISKNTATGQYGAGGMYVEYFLTITNSAVSYNTGNIGGVSVDGELTMESCELIGNESKENIGGGVYVFGEATITGSLISGNIANGDGGGICIEGTAEITNSTISNNYANDGEGGGIYVESTSTITNCIISNNSSKTNGGGITAGGNLTLTNCTLSKNSAENAGGGIYTGYDLSLNNCTISNNYANGEGGGIWCDGTIFELTDCVISKNETTGCGGGIFTYCGATITNCEINGNKAAVAGGIYHQFEMTIINSIISDNEATSGNGGGIFCDDDLTIQNSTIANNSAASGNGGAIYADYNITITDCEIYNNTAAVGNGGAICILPDYDCTITNCRIYKNSASNGGALYNDCSYPTITNCEFFENTASSNGGAIFSRGIALIQSCNFTKNETINEFGGAIYNTGEMAIKDSSISNNCGNDGGGAIYNVGGLTLENCELLNNKSSCAGAIYDDGGVTIINCTIKNNEADDGNNIFVETDGMLTFEGENLIDGTIETQEPITINSGATFAETINLKATTPTNFISTAIITYKNESDINLDNFNLLNQNYRLALGKTEETKLNVYISNEFIFTYDLNYEAEPITQTYEYGATLTKISNPTRTHYVFAGWYTEAECETEYTFTTMPANDVTVYAKWEKATYTITATANAGGTITPSGATGYEYLDSATYTFAANVGYYISEIKVDNVALTQNELTVAKINGYKFTDISANHTISVSFSITKFTITVTQAANGSISAAQSSYNYGTNASFTITPNAGYSIECLIIDGAEYTTGTLTAYTFTNITANHTISAKFAINRYTVTVTQAANGTISAAQSSYAYGSEASFTITPNAGYSIECLIIDGTQYTNGILTAYTFKNITANHTISAKFVINKYTITVTQAANGSISAAQSSYNYGTNASFTITPNAGYSIECLIIDGAEYTTGTLTAYTFTNITANHTISAKFTAESTTTYTVKHWQESLTQTGATKIGEKYYVEVETETKTGTTATYTQATAKTYTGFTAEQIEQQVILGNATTVVNVLYARNTYEVVILTDSGILSTTGAGEYKYGQEVTVTAEVKSSYTWMGWTSANSGVNDSTNKSYTFTMPIGAVCLTANTTIVATTYTLTATAGENGTINPAGTRTVEAGDSITYTITPNVGYVIKDVKVDNVSQGVINTYAFTEIDNNHTIYVEFEIIKFTITVTQAANGTISAAQSSYNYGTNASFTITPNAGYSIECLIIDGAEYTTGTLTTYTFTNITANHTISAKFTAESTTTYTVKHWQESLTETGATEIAGKYYVEVETETKTGTTATYTQATAKTYTGFTAEQIEQQVILGNATTVVNVLYARNTYEVVLVNDGGLESITGAGKYKFGQAVTVTATLKQDYLWNKWATANASLDDGLSKEYTFTMPAENVCLTATTEKYEFNVIINQPLNGTITPNTNQKVVGGSSLTLQLHANAGYTIQSLIVNGIDCTSLIVDNEYVIENIVENKEVSATFAILTYQIVSSAEGNGTISPEGTIMLNYGETKTYEFTPSAGYKVKDVKVDNESKGALTSYTFERVNASHTVVVEYEAIKLNVITNVDGQGTITSAQSLTNIAYGDSRLLEIEVESGWEIYKLYINGVAVEVQDNQVMLKNITQDLNVQLLVVQPQTNEGNGGLTVILIILSVAVAAGVVILVLKKLKTRRAQLKAQDMYDEKLEKLIKETSLRKEKLQQQNATQKVQEKTNTQETPKVSETKQTVQTEQQTKNVAHKQPPKLPPKKPMQ